MREVLDKALDEWGTKEIVGKKHNPEVLKYFGEIGHSWVKNDELAWCSAFINWCAKKAGFDYTGKLNARSWLDIGKQIIKPAKGDLVIFWRKNLYGPFGHVGLFIRETKSFIYVLGGNQNNQVGIKAYPKKQFLEYRRLKKQL